jgi:hypothetical protein
MSSVNEFGRAILGASGVANKMFIAFLFTDTDVGIQFLKDVGFIPRSIVSCRCDSQMSWCVDTGVKNGY